MIISSAQDVLLDVRVLSGSGSVLDPNSNAELLRQAVLEDIFRNDSSGVSAVELEDLVGLPALVPAEAGGPGCGRSGRGQKVDAVLGGTAELPLGAHGVGVAVAALADVVGGEGQGGPEVPQEAGRVAQLEPGRGQQGLGLDTRGVVDALRDAAPTRRAHPVDLFLTSGSGQKSELLVFYHTKDEPFVLYLCRSRVGT